METTNMGRRQFTALVLGCASLGAAFTIAPHTIAGSEAMRLHNAAYTSILKGTTLVRNADAIPFDGTWQLTHLRGPGGELSGLADDLVARSQILIGADGKLTGTVGCNRFGTSFDTDAGTIAFTGVIATRKACHGPVWDAERGLFAAFKQATAYMQDGDELILLDSADNEIARFVRA